MAPRSCLVDSILSGWVVTTELVTTVTKVRMVALGYVPCDGAQCSDSHTRGRAYRVLHRKKVIRLQWLAASASDKAAARILEGSCSC